MSWAPRIRSSEFNAFADDAAKDDESVAFLAALPLGQQAEWLTRLGWLRVADRLSENQILEPDAHRYETFCAEWRAFVAGADAAGEHENVWREMRAAWFAPTGEVREPQAIASWSGYLDALGEYTLPDLEIPTLGAHDQMLRRLTGNLCQVFPYVRDSQREAAARFGMLDQMLNNLRDIAEDAAHGLCFFPSDVLARFGVARASVLDGSAAGTEAYDAMMRFWLDEHLVTLRRGAEAFLTADDLHPSLVRMREAFVARYARIERVFRACGMDYREFPRVYWGKRFPSGLPRVA